MLHAGSVAEASGNIAGSSALSQASEAGASASKLAADLGVAGEKQGYEMLYSISLGHPEGVPCASFAVLPHTSACCTSGLQAADMPALRAL